MRTISIKNLISRIIRSTGSNIRMDMINSIIEWIAESLQQINVPFTLKVKSEELKVIDHIVELPCDFQELICVEYERKRLRLGGDITDITNQSSVAHSRKLETDYNLNNFYQGDVLNPFPVNLREYNFPNHHKEYYIERINELHFSFEKGKIKLHYRALPLDKEGYPLIVDNENVKQAITWYVLSQLLLTGWKHPANLDYNYCFNMYENIYLPRAINEMKQWSPETAELLLNSNIRLVMPRHFYDDFNVNSENIQLIIK